MVLLSSWMVAVRTFSLLCSVSWGVCCSFWIIFDIPISCFPSGSLAGLACHAGLVIILVRAKYAHLCVCRRVCFPELGHKDVIWENGKKSFKVMTARGPFNFVLKLSSRGSLAWEKRRKKAGIKKFGHYFGKFWSPLMVVEFERSVAACFSSPPLRYVHVL